MTQDVNSFIRLFIYLICFHLDIVTIHMLDIVHRLHFRISGLEIQNSDISKYNADITIIH